MTGKNTQDRQATPENPPVGQAAPFNQVQRVVAIMSGKGGVGKSLVTGLLAAALAREGYRVGVLDADVTGPSVPRLFGLHGPVGVGEHGIVPLESAGGVRIMSFNLLLERDDQPVIWRGPLIGRAIQQLWGEVAWGELDYLLVDLPPGTADAALTVMQSLPLDGILMVTTPQSLAAMIVRKAVHMAQMVGVPIVGIVENMSYFVCPDTGKRHEIFGPSHANDISALAAAPLLARLPLDAGVSAECDAGKVEDIRSSEMPGMLKAFVKVVPAGRPPAGA